MGINEVEVVVNDAVLGNESWRGDERKEFQQTHRPRSGEKPDSIQTNLQTRIHVNEKNTPTDFDSTTNSD
jgi:hypothetical protein